MGVVETAVALTIEVVCGAAAGLALGRWTTLGLGAKVDALTGAIGGLALTWLAGHVPGVGPFVGKVESAVDATARGVGVLTPAILVGVGVAGLLGGFVLTACIAFTLGGVRRRGRPEGEVR
ncbi:hypothetical protein MesoLj131a_23320 [Mesorhizobium sp. 131-2-1]|nr:hypothetical protein MesoLj131a_23320 [Mesorhizobium sp. 131-2-1]